MFWFKIASITGCTVVQKRKEMKRKEIVIVFSFQVMSFK
jgi:hypothetical protein